MSACEAAQRACTDSCRQKASVCTKTWLCLSDSVVCKALFKLLCLAHGRMQGGVCDGHVLYGVQHGYAIRVPLQRSLRDRPVCVRVLGSSMLHRMTCNLATQSQWGRCDLLRGVESPKRLTGACSKSSPHTTCHIQLAGSGTVTSGLGAPATWALRWPSLHQRNSTCALSVRTLRERRVALRASGGRRS